MSGYKQVRGLLDMFGDDNDADHDVPESAVADFVLGLGWGATDQARRWASMGRALEARVQNRRPAHRPTQDPITHKDAIRAFAAWEMCWTLRKILRKPEARISNRELIRAIQAVEAFLKQTAAEKLFPERENLDASLSRGKKILGIDRDWNCKLCEEVQRTFPKTTE